MNKQAYHKGLNPCFDVRPGGQDTKRHNDCRQKYKEDGNTVYSNGVVNIKGFNPTIVFYKLEFISGLVKPGYQAKGKYAHNTGSGQSKITT